MAPLNSNFNFLEFGKDASKLGRYGGAVEFLQSPSLRTGASAGLKYFANANPYYAGINAITRGGLDKLLDKGLGAFKKRGPAQNAKETTQLIDYARRSMEDTNRLRDVYGQSITNAEQAKAARDLFRKSVARLKAEGASAREMQPMMAQIAARNAQLGQASQSRLAANLSARGINPATGIGAGAMAGLEGQLAGANASGMAQLQTAALNRALQGEQMLFSADVADQARANANAMASAGAIAEQNRAIAAFQEQQKLAQQARDQAMWERRMKESTALGQGLTGLASLYLQGRQPKQKKKIGQALDIQNDTNADVQTLPLLQYLANQSIRPTTSPQLLMNPELGFNPTDAEYNYSGSQPNNVGDISSYIESAYALQNQKQPQDGDTFNFWGGSYTKIGGTWYRM